MTREQFIQKWLACKWVYDEGTRDLMRDDLDKVTEQQCDYVQQLFTRPQEVFKPLQELYRKENPHPECKFYIPDATKFFQWIANKVNEYECLRNSEHLLNIPCVRVTLPTNDEFWNEWNKHKDPTQLWLWLQRRQ